MSTLRAIPFLLLIAMPNLGRAQDVELSQLRPSMIVRVQQIGDQRVIGILLELKQDTIVFRPGTSGKSVIRPVRVPITSIIRLDYLAVRYSANSVAVTLPDLGSAGEQPCPDTKDVSCPAAAVLGGALEDIGSVIGKLIKSISKEPTKSDDWRRVRLK
jgi:hypothetical protein